MIKNEDNLHRDFIWECDYGERTLIFNSILKLVSTQNSNELGMCTIFTNNNPYQLEFFVVFGYENPQDGQISLMLDIMSSSGSRLKTNLTFSKMIEYSGQKRFNMMSIIDENDIILANNTIFSFPEKAVLSQNIPMGPLGNELPIFLSHSSKDKPFIEDVIPFLNRYDLAVWYDKVNISYGQSIVNEIQNGIEDSGAVIFFITNSFLESNWCSTEMESFFTKLNEGDKILIISVVFPDVTHQKLPRFIKNKKYVKLEKDDNPELLAKEIIPDIKKYLNKSK